VTEEFIHLFFSVALALLVVYYKGCFGTPKVLNTTYTTNNILYMEDKNEAK